MIAKRDVHTIVHAVSPLLFRPTFLSYYGDIELTVHVISVLLTSFFVLLTPGAY